MKKVKYFATQQNNEEIIILTRAHPVVLVPLFLTMAVIYLIGLFVVFLLPLYFPFFSEGSIPNIISVVMALYFLFGTLYFFIEWLLYYLRIGIVSNINVVDIHQKSLFSRKISELNLDNIEDVSASEEGVLQTMVHFGNVHIQTAGELPNFVFENVPKPYQISRRIMELKDNMLNHRNKFFETHTAPNSLNNDYLRSNSLGQNPEPQNQSQASQSYNPQQQAPQPEPQNQNPPFPNNPQANPHVEEPKQEVPKSRDQIDYDSIDYQEPETPETLEDESERQ